MIESRVSPRTPARNPVTGGDRRCYTTPSRRYSWRAPGIDGDSPYSRAKFAQLVDKNPEKAVALFWQAINHGDKIDSALKDMAAVLQQVHRAEEAIEAIQSFRNKCHSESQEQLDNILLDLYKKCGRVDDEIQLLNLKLERIDKGVAFGGRATKLARSKGKRVYLTIEQERARLLGNLGWAYMQCQNYEEAVHVYREALKVELDINKQCNLAICLTRTGQVQEAQSLLQEVKESLPNCSSESSIRSFHRAYSICEHYYSPVYRDTNQRFQSRGPSSAPRPSTDVHYSSRADMKYQGERYGRRNMDHEREKPQIPSQAFRASRSKASRQLNFVRPNNQEFSINENVPDADLKPLKELEVNTLIINGERWIRAEQDMCRSSAQYGSGANILKPLLNPCAEKAAPPLDHCLKSFINSQMDQKFPNSVPSKSRHWSPRLVASLHTMGSSEDLPEECFQTPLVSGSMRGTGSDLEYVVRQNSIYISASVNLGSSFSNLYDEQLRTQPFMRRRPWAVQIEEAGDESVENSKHTASFVEPAACFKDLLEEDIRTQPVKKSGRTWAEMVEEENT